MRGRKLWWALPPAAVVALAVGLGCSPLGTGVLGNGGFQYVCSGQDGDIGCTSTSSGSVASLPGAVAVGAKFQLGYAPKSSEYSEVQGATGYEVIPASPDLAAATAQTVVAQKAGYVALLARHVGNSEVDDFVHLKLAAIAKLQTSEPTVTINAGEAGSAQVLAFDKLGAPLAGQLPCTWQMTNADPTVLEWAPTPKQPSTTGMARLKAGCNPNGGSITLHATCGPSGGQTQSVDVTVQVSPPSGSCNAGLDGGSDADSLSGNDASDGGNNG